MSTTKISLQCKFEIKANIYEEIRSEAVNAFHMAVVRGKPEFLSWLTNKTITYDINSKAVQIYPFVCVVQGTAISIGDMHDLDNSLAKFNLDDDSKDLYLYIEYYQTYLPRPTEPVFVLSTDQIIDVNHALIASYDSSSKSWIPEQDLLAFNNLDGIDVGKLLQIIQNHDGQGSGIDADTLDGLHSSSFVRTDANSNPTTDNMWAVGSSEKRFKEIHAVTFYGTASESTYADLAEKFNGDESLEVGDVVTISRDSKYEICRCSELDKPIGVVSDNPAYIMNTDLKNGIPIALKGRVKCKVKGSVHKGDLLMPLNGVGIVTTDKNNCFAIALESSTNFSVKLVEVVVL